MKKLIAVGLSSVLALPVLSLGFAFAHAETETTTTTQTSTDKTETETSNPTDKELLERIQTRKAELKTKLAAAEKLKLQNKCQASQGKVSSIRGRIKGIETSRSHVYTNMVDHLKDLSDKLKNKGVDTTELDASITALETKIKTFNDDLAIYKTAVGDVADMDCKADPDGFKASLEAARAALKKVNDDGAAVKAQVKDVIKPLLKTIRQQLETDKQEGEQ